MMRVLSDMVTMFKKRRGAYRALFAPGPAADIVMRDLRKFCRATTTPAVISPVTQQIDPIATGIAIGRLEVYHRIAQHIHMSDSDLYRTVDNNEESQNEY